MFGRVLNTPLLVIGWVVEVAVNILPGVPSEKAPEWQYLCHFYLLEVTFYSIRILLGSLRLFMWPISQILVN